MFSQSPASRSVRRAVLSLTLFAPLAAPHVADAQTTRKAAGRGNSKVVARAAAISAAQDVDIAPFVPLQGSVPSAVAAATKLAPMKGDQKLSLLVCFQFADPQAAEDYANAVSDPHSLLYRQWLTPQEVGLKFGPDPADYAAMVAYLQSNGFQIEETPVNRLTVRASGTVGQAQQAFGVTLSQYRETAAQAQALRGAGALPYAFCAPDGDVQLPGALAGKITSVEGLENYTRPIQRSKKAKRASANFDAVQPRYGYNVAPMYNTLNATANNKPGTGRTVGISNFDGFNVVSNASPFITRNSLPFPAAGKATNISTTVVGVADGTNGAAEGDLDFQAVLGQAPLASIIIYDSANYDLIGVLSKEASDNKADVLTESYGWNLTPPTAASAHNQHVTMTTQGQTYLAASGDNGNELNLVQGYVYDYPNYEPEVLVIGGTILTVGAGNAYSSETGWNGSGGGYSNATTYINVLPSWQKGRSVPTTPNKRLAPDISSHSAGANGNAYYIYYGGSLISISGTSCASPVTAGQIALTEQYLISLGYLTPNAKGKQRLGRLNDKIYAFNGRNDIFHDVKTGSSVGGSNANGGSNPGFSATPYWDYVTGWGSVNWYNFATALTAPLSVTVTPGSANLAAGQPKQFTAAVAGSNVTTVAWSVVSGPGTISSSGLYTAPASVTNGQTATVQATSAIDTANPNVTTASFQPNPVFGQATVTLTASTATVSGVVTLEGVADPTTTVTLTNPVTIVLTPTGGGSPVTVTQTLGAGGSFSVSNLPVASYSVNIKGDKWLSATTSADASAGNVTGVAATLRAGDANNDNTVDTTDFGVLVSAYNSSVSVPGSGYDATADFNNDGNVDTTDFGLLVGNYNSVGQ